MVNNKAYRGFVLRTVVVTMLALLLAGGAGAVTEINLCTTISSSGDYVLNQSIMDSAASSCINITSSDVIFDGAGFTIDGVDAIYTNGVVVFNATTLTNVTVKNLKVTDWYNGIIYSNVANGKIENNNASSNPNTGIYLSGSSNNNLSGNNVPNNLGGILIAFSSNNNLISNNASNNPFGIELANSSYNYLTGNDVSNNGEGIFLLNSSDNNLTSNIVSNNTYVGIDLLVSSNNNIYNNFFNNSNNVVTNNYVNTWNITETPGTNVVGGPNLGGNVWANPSGTGFSQTCADGGNDGICDSPYTLDSNNTDYLPLALKAGAQTPIVACGVISSPGEYVLTADLTNSTTCITINSSDVIFDGAGHSITGIGPAPNFGSGAFGIYVHNISTTLTNITVKNLVVTNWDYGIYYSITSNGSIINNTVISNAQFGIILEASLNSTLTNNTAESNSNAAVGIYLRENSNNNTLTGNNASTGGSGIAVRSGNNNTLTGNNASNNDGAGIFILDNSNTLTGNTAWYNVHGIILNRVSNNTLTDNNASNNGYYGILLQGSNNNTLTGNNASNNGAGIRLEGHNNNNTLTGNNVSNNNYGIQLYIGNTYNTLTGNNASNNNIGIRLEGSGGFVLDDNNSYNTLAGNNVSNNNIGIHLDDVSSNNTIYNNYFNNSNNFEIINSINIWNITETPGTNIIGGRNLGGNAWAYPNRTGFSEICADVNGDGICDSSYVLDNNNTDYLPLTYNPGISVQSSTGRGPVYFETDAGTIENLIAVKVSDIPESPPMGVNLPYGLFRFNITGLTPGGSANLTLTFPAPLPPDTSYWKFGPNASNATPHWYNITAAINGNKLTVMLTDNGTGDDDLTTNGVIVDPSGPSFPIHTGNVTGGGWITSPIKSAPKNNNKATFGFVAHFVNGIPTGNLEYIDHVSGMKVKGNVTTLNVDKAAMNATFMGTATINGTGAYAYTIKVHDGGEPGRMDTFAINITAISYMANGTLGGGNIQIRDP